MMRTLKDLIQEVLCKGGLEQAASVEVKLQDGTKLTISSDDHPALGRSAEDVAQVTPRQTAQGGK